MCLNPKNMAVTALAHGGSTVNALPVSSALHAVLYLVEVWAIS